MNINEFSRSWISVAGISVDVAGMSLDLEEYAYPLKKAMLAMKTLESGGIANQDENRQVGHYWLRNSDICPTEYRQELSLIAPEKLNVIAKKLIEKTGATQLLHLGIGGSALGPQLLSDALQEDGLEVIFFDNTDPDGMTRLFRRINPVKSLVLVVSKSGGTVETKIAMERVKAFFEQHNVDFASRAIAITGKGSKLANIAQAENWLYTLPMWDWVGGRTSVTSAVGLMPASFMGINGSELLEGARIMDEATRSPYQNNPAAWLAASWFWAQEEHPRAMVVLPYADRLEKLGRYLQQLIMESIGKRHDRGGWEVSQGLTVYGNKGSTDQHAYVQQLRDGPDDFFVNFVEVLKPRGEDITLSDGFTAGDALSGFLNGTREALENDDKLTLTITLDEITPRTIGALIALYERAVGIYAELLNINAYDQPGVEAGKIAAKASMEAQNAIISVLTDDLETVEEISSKAQINSVLAYRILARLAACGRISGSFTEISNPAEARFARL